MDTTRRIQKAIPSVYDDSLSYYEVLQSLIGGMSEIDSLAQATASVVGGYDSRIAYIESNINDHIINAGNSNAEVVDARKKSDGTTFAKLGDRLNSIDAQVAEVTKPVYTIGLPRGLEAHRGCLAYAPENTLKAVEDACRLGYATVELDARKTKDGVWILMHDETIERTTNGSGTVSNMTWANIQTVLIDDPSYTFKEDEVFKVPLLEDCLKVCAAYRVGVDIDGSKFTMSAENITEIYALLKKYGIDDISYIVCPSEADRALVHSIAPNLCIGWIGGSLSYDIGEAARYKNNVLVALRVETLTDELLHGYMDNNIAVMPFNVSTDHATLYKWLEKGVHLIETEYILPKKERH